MPKLSRRIQLKKGPNTGRWTQEYKAAWNKKWIQDNRQRYNASKYKYRESLKLEVLAYYGKGAIACNYCGFNNIDALCLDHIADNGADHRRELGISGRGNKSGTNTYEALKGAGMPDGLQILCANCNMIKELQRKRDKRLQNPFYKPVTEEVMPDA